MSFNAIRENKVLTKISGFTVYIKGSWVIISIYISFVEDVFFSLEYAFRSFQIFIKVRTPRFN